MKKIFLFGCLFLAAFVSRSQDHEDINPNITPYHEGQDAINGKNGIRFNKSQAWKNFEQKHPNWGCKFDHYSGMPTVATGPAFKYEFGTDPVSKAKHFLTHELKELNVPASELELSTTYSDKKFTYVHFIQKHEGKQVSFSQVTVRMSKEQLLIQSFSVRAYANIPNGMLATLTPADAQKNAEQDLTTTIISSKVQPQLEIFALPGEMKNEFALVYVVQTATQDSKEMDGDYTTYVDANTGKIIYRSNKVVHIDGKIKGPTYTKSAFSPVVNMPLADIKVIENGTTYYTDANGNFSTPSNTPSATINVQLSGRWSTVTNGATSTVVPSMTATIMNNDSLIFDTTAAATQATKVNMYYAVGIVHDYMKTKFPSFTGLDFSLPTRVDRTDGNCNAFYNGSSINFYATDATCNATGFMQSVCYHEYGHGINDKYYASLGGNWQNGGMGEGYADIWSINIENTPIVGQGFYVGSPSSSIRRYDGTPKVYPQDLVGQVHADGEIIAGAWWDTYQNWGNQVAASDLFAETYGALSTAPNGQEGSLYFQILIDALTYNDIDNNIINGTPNDVAIIKGFARHGIYILGDAEVLHNGNLIPTANVATTITTDVTASFPPLVNNVKMIYRLKQTPLPSPDTLVLSKVGTTQQFTASFPGKTAGQLYEYIFGVTDILSVTDINAIAPLQSLFSVTLRQRNIPYYLPIECAATQIEDFETGATGWKISQSTDNATGGKWILAKPIPSFINNEMVQTDKDHTTGSGKCVVTGNAASSTSQSGSADVDNGHTVILSPVYNLSEYKNPMVSYWRWFSNSQGQNDRKDIWQVMLSDNGGLNWTPIDRTYQPDVQWRRQVVRIKDAKLSVNLNSIQFAFVAVDSLYGDYTSGSLVEAAVDDFSILDIANPSSIATMEEAGIEVYPNPANDFVKIQFGNAFTGSVTLLDITGKVVYSATANVITQTTIPTVQLSNGFYLLQLKGADGQMYTKKLQVNQ